MSGKNKLLDMSVAARRLGVSTATVYRLKYKNVLPVIKTGASKGYKIKEADLERYKYLRDNDLLD